ncbi:DUF2059 domain-containing protein [Cognatishimia activa]|uniref:DUF2059 domain-containing protein n=1 Tax=Cognatishimia activa TaxID=1715691 RepID=A0A0P1IP91_9RHOB|nr:DUF2059 domain-containing protein [Cognatishimia activa]CUJ27731.1 hypothetical protein TA5113_02863 [Cognatishimia activa]CUK25275.1 hypothetical protein TA5114_01068 [Cognatishimia activa]
MLTSAFKTVAKTAVSCVAATAFLATSAFAANREDVKSFLETTGFDVAIESIAVGAGGAPAMLGLEGNEFGQAWTDLTEKTFVPEEMVEQALDLLEERLDQDLLQHAADFYGSDLGQRLVHTENLSHMDDDEIKNLAGRQIVAKMVEEGDPKIGYFQRMHVAIDPEGLGLKAVQVIQVRFILAASRAGVIRDDLDEGMLWAQIEANEPATRRAILENSIASAAYTYQGFTGEELEAYTEALEDERMQTVYQVMNAVHYQIMSDRMDALALHLDRLMPSEEL